MPERFSPIKLLDYLFVLRPMLFYPGWSTLLAGYFIADKRQLFFGAQQIAGAGHAAILLLFLIFALAMGGSFLLNQLRDVESDRKNNKLFIISEGHISLRAAWIEALLLIVVSTVLAFGVSFRLGVLIAAFNLLTGYLYNFAPFRMKDYPWRSLLANALMGWLAFALGWSYRQQLDWKVVWDALPYVFLNTALYFYTTLPDIGGDQAAQKQTLSVKYSLRAILTIAFVLFVLAVAFAVGLGDYTALSILALSAPFFITTIVRKTIQNAVRATKYTILIFALIVCLKWPYYFLLMAAGFYFTKWYYRKRFDFDYPNFSGN